ncbi:hypothetical protein A2382_04655 [Candidatus Woesebacteria bacterium RIFOXYB1_FULL_38_16]|uniref:Ribbon-helix-helix protein CopG domain-containing protein n=1 Tax=Candidatus Woesebacteria bacterium RIFOXYB1_FULL_38_16 TaxID=1802538 RepID=A0A1F8CVV3_9BACT|nr:MAG: hypothetical protein A2191_02135 [Candidatus Woesebacteria bacterium RIFOXYA1_FULL_38_9]OGM79949.1 MAG: hypothetical protein A2382_04655 [Candidatus Woesebacteria bacterium RIFOXYB1_FULL_38_16]
MLIFFMLKTYLYIPEPLEEKIIQVAQSQSKSKAEIMRQALERGIIAISKHGMVSAQALLQIEEVGKKYRSSGPKDLSANLDLYLWKKIDEAGE